MDKITIRFEGEREAIAPLTWAQRRTYRGSRFKHRPFVCVQSVPPGKSLREVGDAAKWAFEEFESLRTVFPLGAGGEPFQKVEKVGSAEIFIIPAGESTVEADIKSAIHRLQGERFDVTAEFGALFAIVTCVDVPTHLICLVSHLSVDGHGRGALGAALDSHLSGQYDRPSTPLMQPVDRAQLEQSTKWQERSDRSLEYWKSVLEKLPQDASRSAVMDSDALGAAVSVISKKYAMGTPAVYLAALSVVAGALIGRDKSSFLLPASNRLNLEERSFVGELVQFAPGVLESLDRPFEAIINDAWRASAKGYRFSRYDEQALQLMLTDLDEGREYKRAFDFSFNDVRNSTEGEAYRGVVEKIRDLTKRTKIELREKVPQGGARFLSFTLWGEGSQTLSIAVHDSYFPELPVGRILLAIEALAVGVALGDAEALNHPLRFARECLT
ncbi:MULTISPECIES: condensation domain-containing protein [unclassified Streptomyces]|uniref:condensation domain-containing protein n=1 Tax=unclassified Streptomyces TaxID=2593676 RepID=UPI0023655BF3|nr:MULTISPECIES: condensation domain-containing protein [unclassified Streptomyces]MDF3139896.1 condensation domain-containing protein [Streptomyces sp. T21Q-yed]WDF43985.1 condensation domain-containing protein [Streptomyces sp. T12]